MGALELDVVLRHKILVVEDSEIQAKKLQFFLEKFGYDAIIASDGEEALSALSSNEQISLVIAGVKTSRIGGLELLKRMRDDQRFSRVPFMLLASHEESDSLSIQATDVNDLLIKPFRPAELQVRLRNLIALAEYEQFLSEENKQLSLELVEKNQELERNYSKLQSAHDELRELQAQLVQSAKMVSMGILSTGIAHEINNPLAIIMGFNARLGTMVKTGDFDRDQVTKVHDRISTSITRIVRIVDSLRSLSAKQKAGSSFLPFELDSVLPTLTDFFGELAAKRGVDVVFELNARSKMIVGDPNKIRQAILNVVQNALDAMESAEVRKLRISSFERDGNVCVQIGDTGHGIPDDIREKIFDPFFTTRDPDRGTGLGLTLAYRFVKDCGGEVTFESGAEGTTFNISFPVMVL